MWRTEATGVPGGFLVTLVSSPRIRGKSLATVEAWSPLSSPRPQLLNPTNPGQEPSSRSLSRTGPSPGAAQPALPLLFMRTSAALCCSEGQMAS